MCGRYKVSTPGDELWETFDIHGEIQYLPPHYNIAPTQPIAIIREPHHLEFARWGLKLPNSKAGGINVRVESLAAPMYRESIRHRRCLILADGFYEWKAIPNTKKKQPYLIHRKDNKPFAFAGIWDDVLMPNGEVIPAAAILTTTPRGVAAQVHDRMPLVLPAKHLAAWLDPTSRYRDLLQPDADALVSVPLGPAVNSPKNDGPECIEPAPELSSLEHRP
jgi:putative SOS response-associated peptidase YedK